MATRTSRDHRTNERPQCRSVTCSTSGARTAPTRPATSTRSSPRPARDSPTAAPRPLWRVSPAGPGSHRRRCTARKGNPQFHIRVHPEHLVDHLSRQEPRIVSRYGSVVSSRSTSSSGTARTRRFGRKTVSISCGPDSNSSSSIESTPVIVASRRLSASKNHRACPTAADESAQCADGGNAEQARPRITTGAECVRPRAYRYRGRPGPRRLA
jgi:hypothetical protein